jgi:hypothetical protein
MLESEIGQSVLRELLDRQQITDCLLRYTRGVDRVDADLIRSAFHPDAIDHHGPVTGTVEDFLDYWLPLQSVREASMHYLTNVTIDLDGDSAHVESYFTYYGKFFGDGEMLVVGGRYADRFERRETGWRIALRVVISEWAMKADGTMTTTRLAERNRARRDRSDLAYVRPLLGPHEERRGSARAARAGDEVTK